MRWLAQLALASLVGATSPYLVSDASGLGREFLGVGAISGGGATSRLLVDYEEPYRSQVLDYLFLPQFGAALQTLKVEIGSGADTTNGSEPPHKYFADEDPVYTRGYEWWLIDEAKKRNPQIQVYGLPWGWPAWVGDGNTSTPYNNPATPAQYITDWVAGVQQHGHGVDYIGLWNEKSFTDDYIVTLRRTLDAAGYNSTKIVASDDGGWPAASHVLANATVAEAVFALGSHYPGSTASEQALQTGKPLFASEDNSQSALADANGGACWARVLAENQAHGNFSGSISWSLICSWYAGIEFYGDGLMVAVQPWSGNYYVGAPIWSTAHTTQFTQPGWSYLPAGSGVGYLAGGGTHVSLTSPDRSQLTIVVEKMARNVSQCSWSSSPRNSTVAETATFALGGSFAGIRTLHAWKSTFDIANGAGDPTAMFTRQPDISVGSDGTFSIDIEVMDLWTFSTVTTATKGSHPAPPASAPFPMPWRDDFDSYNLTSEARYWSDMNGNFEIVDASPTGRTGRVMRQMTPARPIIWLRHDTTPHSILGDPTWDDVDVSVDAFMPVDGYSAGLGVRCFGLNVDATSCLWFTIDTTGSFNISTAAGNFTGQLGRGSLPVPASAGVWHTMRILASGSNASFYFDGALAATITLPANAVSASGFVAIATTEYGHFTLFDNFSVSPAPSPQPCKPGPPGNQARVVTTSCSNANASNVFILTPLQFASAVSSAAAVTASLSPASAPTLCVAVNASVPEPQTGAPSVQLQPCASPPTAEQSWVIAAGAAAGGGFGSIVSSSSGACLEVTKNELQLGVPLETWACNGGANQQWALQSAAGGGTGVQLVTQLNNACAGVC